MRIYYPTKVVKALHGEKVKPIGASGAEMKFSKTKLIKPHELAYSAPKSLAGASRNTKASIAAGDKFVSDALRNGGARASRDGNRNGVTCHELLVTGCLLRAA